MAQSKTRPASPQKSSEVSGDPFHSCALPLFHPPPFHPSTVPAPRLLGVMDMGSQKIANRSQDATIDVILCLPTCRDLTLGDKQRMVPAFDHVKFICRFHFPSNALQHVQRTEPVASSLHKQNGRCQSPKHVGPKLCPIATTTERVAKADDSSHSFFQREMAPDPRPKAFSDKNRRLAV